jgi:peptidoglycan pentaglycine glycine transferase (the first glycine)
MPIVSLSEWNTFLANHPHAHILQTGEWGELKSAFGWEAVRILSGDTGVQILFRKLPLGFTVAYIPKPVFSNNQSSESRSDDFSRSKATEVATTKFWDEVDSVCKKRRAVFLKIEPDLWEDQPSTFNSKPAQHPASPHHQH